MKRRTPEPITPLTDEQCMDLSERLRVAEASGQTHFDIGGGMTFERLPVPTTADVALRYVAQNRSQHWPAGDGWDPATDDIGDLDLILLDALLRAASHKVTAEMQRRFGAS